MQKDCSPMIKPDPLDEAAIERLKKLARDVARPGEDLLGEIYALYAKDARARAAGIAAACARGAYDEAAALAHALKGASANVGARHVREVAAELEAAARANDAATLEGRAAALVDEVERSLDALASALGAH